LKIFTYNGGLTTDVKELNTKTVKIKNRLHIPTSRVWDCLLGWICGTNTTEVIALTPLYMLYNGGYGQNCRGIGPENWFWPAIPWRFWP